MSTEWKMVPVEPTDKMLSAVWTLHQSRPWPEAGRAAYAAMLAAAPQPAAQPEQPEPGVLTNERAIALWGPRSDGPSNREIVSFARAIEREVLTTTRKCTAEQNATELDALRAERDKIEADLESLQDSFGQIQAANVKLRARCEAAEVLLQKCQDAIDWCAQECGHSEAHELSSRIDAHLKGAGRE